LHALARIVAPQTLKLEGYIKKQRVIVLIDSGSTQNFIDRRVVERLNCSPYPIKNFFVMIANGGSFNCGGICHNIKLTMGDYNLSSTMYAIPIGGVDMVLRVQWLKLIGTISLNLDELFIGFKENGQRYKLHGFADPPAQVISSHWMENLLRKGGNGIIQ